MKVFEIYNENPYSSVRLCPKCDQEYSYTGKLRSYKQYRCLHCNYEFLTLDNNNPALINDKLKFHGKISVDS